MFNVELGCFLTKHWGLGVGYTFVATGFRVDGKDPGDLDFKFEAKNDGLQASASFGFGGTPAGGSR